LRVTIFSTFPEISGPDFSISLAAITLMKAGTVAGGVELLPGSLFQVPSQAGGLGLGAFAKPLKLEGAALPSLKEFDLAHCAPQKVT
jgi:hypothetical protein